MNEEEINKIKKEGWILLENSETHTTWTFDIPKEVEKAMEEANIHPGFLSKHQRWWDRWIMGSRY